MPVLSERGLSFADEQDRRLVVGDHKGADPAFPATRETQASVSVSHGMRHPPWNTTQNATPQPRVRQKQAEVNLHCDPLILKQEQDIVTAQMGRHTSIVPTR